jgi:hypothetical protein
MLANVSDKIVVRKSAPIVWPDKIFGVATLCVHNAGAVLKEQGLIIVAKDYVMPMPVDPLQEQYLIDMTLLLSSSPQRWWTVTRCAPRYAAAIIDKHRADFECASPKKVGSGRKRAGVDRFVTSPPPPPTSKKAKPEKTAKKVKAKSKAKIAKGVVKRKDFDVFRTEQRPTFVRANLRATPSEIIKGLGAQC